MRIASRPPSGMASRALTAMLSKADSSWARSASTVQASSASAVGTSIRSPSVRSSRSVMPRISALTSITSGWSGWRRAKASSCPVSAAALPDAWTTASAKRMRLSSSRPGRRSMSAEPWMTVSRLLKSWAMPPVSWPSACILCAWRSWSSALLRSPTWTFNSALAPASASARSSSSRLARRSALWATPSTATTSAAISDQQADHQIAGEPARQRLGVGGQDDRADPLAAARHRHRGGDRIAGAGERLGEAARRLGAVAAIARDQRAARVVDADAAHLPVDADRVDRLVRRARVAEIERGGDAGGEDVGLDPRLLLLQVAIGGLALHDDADAGEQQQHDHGDDRERRVAPAFGKAGGQPHQRRCLTPAASASSRELIERPRAAAFRLVDEEADPAGRW